MATTSWGKKLIKALEQNGETLEQDLVATTLDQDSMDKTFDDGYGGEEGCAFTLWTKKRVYFPACYDGSEWVASVPRNPSKEAVEHVGGG